MTLSVDFVMIIGKYFETEKDFVNIVRVSRRYEELLLMYKFNPISNAELFPNIETQHFYEYRDVFYRRRGMYKYIYWIQPFLLNKYFSIIDPSKCVVKNVSINKMLHYCVDMGFEIGTVYNTCLFGVMKGLRNGYVVFKYVNTYFGFGFRNKRITEYFVNNAITDISLTLTESSRFKDKRYYVRQTKFDSAMVIERMDDMTVTIELGKDFESMDIPKRFEVFDYVILDND